MYPGRYRMSDARVERLSTEELRLPSAVAFETVPRRPQRGRDVLIVIVLGRLSTPQSGRSDGEE